MTAKFIDLKKDVEEAIRLINSCTGKLPTCIIIPGKTLLKFRPDLIGIDPKKAYRVTAEDISEDA